MEDDGRIRLTVARELAPDNGRMAFVVTARVEEGENLRVWGEDYAAYMKKSKMFLPFII